VRVWLVFTHQHVLTIVNSVSGVAPGILTDLHSTHFCEFSTFLGAMLKECCGETFNGSARELLDQCLLAVLPLANGYSLKNPKAKAKQWSESQLHSCLSE
jgi:hypothetical protein